MEGLVESMLITSLLIGFALILTRNTLRFLRTAKRARGALVGYERFRDDEGDWLHRPVFRITDECGQVITAVNPRTVWVVRLPLAGQQFNLIYNPDNPAQVVRATWHEVWFGPLVVWIAGIAGLIGYFV
jgi:hypothetical protein